MKKRITFLCAGVLGSALCAGFAGCNKSGPLSDIDPNPLDDCWAFVSSIPGEETILLAKSGISWEEKDVIRDSLEAEYGEGNVHYCGSIPFEELYYLSLQDYNTAVDPEALPDCYEITMTIEFPADRMPSTFDDFIGFGFRGVRMEGRTAVCKLYDWAFTEEGAAEFISKYEKSYRSANSPNYPWSGGTIVGTSTMKKLGPELHNMPIIF